MKILHVSPSFYPAHVYGGPTQSAYRLCRSLAELGNEVRVLTTNSNGLDEVLDVDTRAEVRVDGLGVRYCRRIFRHSVSPTFVRLLSSYVSWADVVHLHYVYSFPTFPTLLQCRRLGKPVVWSPQGGLQRWQGSSRRSLKTAWDFLWHQTADLPKLIVHVTGEQESLETSARFPDLRIRVIANGVDIPCDLHPTEHGEGTRLLFLGRLHPIKGIENLLGACGILLSDPRFQFRLTIAGWGEPDYVAHLRQQISNLSLNDFVTLADPIVGEAKKKLFEDSNVVIVPSHSESFGLVVAEALAHGVPVIASRGTPWKDLEQQQCGLWVKNDPTSLAAAIRSISTMPLCVMGQRGRAWMQREFSWELIGKRMMDLYYESLAS